MLDLRACNVDTVTIAHPRAANNWLLGAMECRASPVAEEAVPYTRRYPTRIFAGLHTATANLKEGKPKIAIN